MKYRVVAEVPFSPSSDYLMPYEARAFSKWMTRAEADKLAAKWRKRNVETGGLPDRFGYRHLAVISVEAQTKPCS